MLPVLRIRTFTIPVADLVYSKLLQRVNTSIFETFNKHY